MKKKYLLLILILIFAVFASCGKKGPEDDGPTDIKEGQKQYLIAESDEEMDFATLYADDLYTTFESGEGLYIHYKENLSIPYVYIQKYEGVFETNSLVSGFVGNMKTEYGDNFVSAGDLKYYTYGGKTLPGVEIHYMVGEYEVVMEVVVENSYEGSYTYFMSKYLVEDVGINDEVMNDAIKYFQPSKQYYRQGGAAAATDNQNVSKPEQAEITENNGNQQNNTQQNGLKAVGTFENEWFSITLPVGWNIYWGSLDGLKSSWSIYAQNPDCPDMQIMICPSIQMYRSKADYDFSATYPVWGAYFQNLGYMDKYSPDIHGFYQNYNTLLGKGLNDIYPLRPMNDWMAVDFVGTTPLGGDIVMATYKNQDSVNYNGIFTARWYSGPGGGFPDPYYDLIFYTAPAEEFDEWKTTLNYCTYSIRYTDKYFKTAAQEQDAVMDDFRANTEYLDYISELIVRAWDYQ